MPNRTSGNPAAVSRSSSEATSSCMANAHRKRLAGSSGVRDRGTEDGEHLVADELHHGPTMAVDDRHGVLVVPVEQIAHPRRLQGGRQRREVANVTEHHGHVTPNSGHCRCETARVFQLTHHVGRNIGREQAPGSASVSDSVRSSHTVPAAAASTTASTGHTTFQTAPPEWNLHAANSTTPAALARAPTSAGTSAEGREHRRHAGSQGDDETDLRRRRRLVEVAGRQDRVHRIGKHDDSRGAA